MHILIACLSVQPPGWCMGQRVMNRSVAPQTPMMPAEPNLLAIWPDMLPRLVHAIDGGLSVSLHAVAEDSINAVCAAMSPFLGGGHT